MNCNVVSAPQHFAHWADAAACGLQESVGRFSDRSVKHIQARRRAISASAAGDRAPRIQEELRCGPGSRQYHETSAVRILHAGNQKRVGFHVMPRIRAELGQQLERIRRIKAGIRDSQGLIR
jgi:hypothetical protein